MDHRPLQHEDQQDEKEAAEVPADVVLDDPDADLAFTTAQREAQTEANLRGDGEYVVRRMFPLDRLVVSSKFQIRAGLTELFVRRYLAIYTNGGTMPPIEVAKVLGRNGEPIYYVTDGYHRIEALSRLGATEVDANIREMPSLNDVLWRGWEMNQHGVHYTREERLVAFKLYFAMGKHLFRRRPNAKPELKSLKQVARELGRDPRTIWKLLHRVNRSLAAKYKRVHTDRAATGEGSFPARTLLPIDVVRRDFKNAILVAQGELPPQQHQIVLAAETMIERLRSLDKPEPIPDEAF